MVGLQLNCPFDRAIAATESVLARHGFEVTYTFDLCQALHALGMSCSCPHHGAEECTCNYVVLAVHAPGEPQRSQRILLHGHGDSTWLSLPAPVSDQGQPPEPGVDPRLVRALAVVLGETDRPLA
ncbi:MAG: hypothetical protein H3C34_27875 [Caldilineaceae bacterium]|jgi:hypothetical protein|nr:hypothetical protein [Caldilineaceae bacterium]